VDHLGATVYCWTPAEQDRLLVQSLGPLARQLRREGLATRFWFDRFDARGPHVLVVLTPAAGARSAVAERLTCRLGGFLATCSEVPGQGAELSAEDVERRHAECRGKVQCVADSYPGLAEANSYCLFDHASRGYPFWLTVDLSSENELWDLIDELAFWAVDRLADGSAGLAAARWVAALDHALSSTVPDPEAFWRYHATTLLTPLAKRLAADEAAVLASLPGWIGERNAAVLARVWSETGASPPPWPHLDSLVRLATDGRDPAGAKRWMALREIIHCALKQLGVPVAAHVPMVLYAWSCHLAERSGK
jgi:hypothetical protein